MSTEKACFICYGQIVQVPISEKLYALACSAADFLNVDKSEIFSEAFRSAFIARDRNRPASESVPESLLEDFLNKIMDNIHNEFASA